MVLVPKAPGPGDATGDAGRITTEARLNPFLLSFLAGPSGKTSSMRVATLLVVVGVLGPWAWVYVESGGVQRMDNEMVLLVLGSLGIKGWQRGVEQREKKTPGEPGA